VHVALYLTYLLNNGSPEHPVSNAVYGIKWAHEINGLDADGLFNSMAQFDACQKIKNNKYIELKLYS
jgi:hypothetical protein